jgi:hypothetical protein
LGVFNVSTLQAMAIMSLLILSWVLLRRKWLAVGLSGLALTLLNMSGENLAVEVPMALLMAVLTLFVAIRIGLLALAFRFLGEHLLTNFPLTLDFSRWYAGRSLFVLLILAGLVVYAFQAALGGKPVFGAAVLEEA